jgi:hypothetical protein
MSKKTSRRRQKLYKMKGCSKKTRKFYLGGSADAPLAYTGQPNTSQPNPFLAYVGKGGGSSVDMINKPNMNLNTNANNPSYPNVGPTPNSNTVYNSSLPQQGGNCSSCSAPLMRGGGCGCGLPFLSGGGRKHRANCKCSNCKKIRNSRNMKGGKPGISYSNGLVGTPWTPSISGNNYTPLNKTINDTQTSINNVGNPPVTLDFTVKGENGNKKKQIGGNSGIPYPNGLVGTPWTPSVGGWPGVNGVPGDSNYISPNQLKTDPLTSIINVGANPPFTVGGANRSRRRKQKGGTLSNFLGQDLINLGRQFQFGLGSTYNALAGYSAPVNPLPWKDQFPVGAPMNPVKPIV